jgi:hypothetical protein
MKKMTTTTTIVIIFMIFALSAQFVYTLDLNEPLLSWLFAFEIMGFAYLIKIIMNGGI